MDAPGMNFKPKGLYIGGHWVPSMGDQTFTTINSSTSEKLGEVPYATEEDVDRAVQAAKQAFPEWGRLPSKERAQCLESLAKRIDENTEELAAMDSYDGGSVHSGTPACRA